ncbi:MAG: hypothetical protein WCA19_02545 [Candidatus Acidiferrales bacterium]
MDRFGVGASASSCRGHAAAAATMASVVAGRSSLFRAMIEPPFMLCSAGPTKRLLLSKKAISPAPNVTSQLKVDPQTDTLRRDPRYTTLLKRLNL